MEVYVKRFAYIKKGDKYTKTNVWKMRKLKQEDEKVFKEIIFYSTHYKIENRRRMSFVNRKPNAYFKYLSNKDNIVSTDESLTHEICKELISDMKILKFKTPKKVFTIYAHESEIEYEIKCKNSKFYIDIFVNFQKSDPASLVTKWNGALAIEVFVSHKTEEKKIDKLYENGYAVVEVDIPNWLKIDESKEVSEEYYELMKSKILKYFSEGIRSNIISNPSSREYKLLYKIHEQNEVIKRIKEDNLNKTNNLSDTNEKNKYLEKELTLHIKKIQTLEQDVLRLQNELIDARKSILRKFIDKFIS
jgi:hypothetical protein